MKSRSIGGITSSSIPQVIAVLVASSALIPLHGINYGYSAVFIAQMFECEEGYHNCSDAIYVTEDDGSWIASAFTVFIPIGAVISGTMMDSFGRLDLIALSGIPGFFGWFLIAMSNNVPMVLLGRMLNGIASAWATCGAFVYISEIANPEIRGAMSSVAMVLAAFGTAITFGMGYLFHWRKIAWISLGLTILTAIVSKLIPESPAWLVIKGRLDEAEKSLRWLNQNHLEPKKLSGAQLELLILLHGIREQRPSVLQRSWLKAKIKMFMEPTVYKPLLILPLFNFFVQFSGVFVVLYYAVVLIKEAGTDMNPFLASACLGTARFIASIFAVGLMRRFGRRQLMVTGGIIMTISMGVSGLYTKWIQEGTTTRTWIPVLMLTLYVTATMISYVSISHLIPAELFPTSARGMAQSISMAIHYGMSFAAVYSYSLLDNLLGGASGLQYFFAGMSLGAVLYSFVFIPETHNKGLYKIEAYFKQHTVYLLYIFGGGKKTESIEIIH